MLGYYVTAGKIDHGDEKEIIQKSTLQLLHWKHRAKANVTASVKSGLLFNQTSTSNNHDNSRGGNLELTCLILLVLFLVHKGSRWDFYYQLLRQFRDRRVHSGAAPVWRVGDSHKLGRWIYSTDSKKEGGGICPQDECRLIKWDWLCLECMRRTLGNHVWGDDTICTTRTAFENSLVYPPRRKRSNIGFLRLQAPSSKKGLAQFKQREGHRIVSPKYMEHLDDGVQLKLGSWMKESSLSEAVRSVGD